MNVYEEIMRMFSTITVEAGNALYSHDQSNQYRYLQFLSILKVFKFILILSIVIKTCFRSSY